MCCGALMPPSCCLGTQRSLLICPFRGGVAGDAKRTTPTSPIHLFDDVALRAVDERQHLASLCGGNLERVQGRLQMADERPPIAFVDAHSLKAEYAGRLFS